jgi:DNA-binding transcriptional LysR family regulator
MNLQQIRYFLAIIEEQNFTRAAKRCRVAQPSLTEAIHRLEREIGGSLFVRCVGLQREALATDLALAVRPHLERAFASVQLAQEAAVDFLRAKGHAAKQQNGTAAIDNISDLELTVGRSHAPCGSGPFEEAQGEVR